MKIPEFMNRLKRFGCEKSANVAILFALCIVPVFGLAGAAIDYSWAAMMRTKLQYASDAAALAAAKAYARDRQLSDASLGEIANRSFAQNIGNMRHDVNMDFEITKIDGGVRVEANSQMPTSVIKILNINSVDISVVSETVASMTKVEVAMVLDNTGSMGWSGKMGALKDASNLFVNTLIPENGESENVKIGIVPYDATINMEQTEWNEQVQALNFVGNRTSCGYVSPRDNPLNTNDTTPTPSEPPTQFGPANCFSWSQVKPLMGLTGIKDALTAKINSMTPSGWTYIPSGLSWGWRVLSPDAPYTEGKPYGDEEWKKMLVLMTDGINTGRWDGADFYGNQPSSHGDVKTRALCDNIKARGIVIYSIAFQAPAGASNLMRECASETSKFYDSDSSADLVAAFSAIAGDINKLRLTN